MSPFTEDWSLDCCTTLNRSRIQMWLARETLPSEFTLSILLICDQRHTWLPRIAEERQNRVIKKVKPRPWVNLKNTYHNVTDGQITFNNVNLVQGNFWWKHKKLTVPRVFNSYSSQIGVLNFNLRLLGNNTCVSRWRKIRRKHSIKINYIACIFSHI